MDDSRYSPTARPSEFLREKEAALADWNEQKRDRTRELRNGGRGYVDPEVIPLCDAINDLDGCFTLQSCSGHPKDESDGAVYPGALWVRLDERRAAKFEQTAAELAAADAIERVAKIYWGDGKETVTLTFKGKESGLLAHSSAFILAYFEQLAR